MIQKYRLSPKQHTLLLEIQKTAINAEAAKVVDNRTLWSLIVRGFVMIDDRIHFHITSIGLSALELYHSAQIYRNEAPLSPRVERLTQRRYRARGAR